MRRLLTGILVGLVSITVSQNALAQQQVKCDFKKWVKDWLTGKSEARNLKDAFSTLTCHFTTDTYYCKVSQDFKNAVIKQSKAYQNYLANEVLSSQDTSFKVCIICQYQSLYNTVLSNPDSIQNLCKKIGDRVANRDNLKYAYDNSLNCNFRVSQAALTDDTFDDVYWNTGSDSVRYWLKDRILADLDQGRQDDLIISEIATGGGRVLQPFVNKYPPPSQDQDGLVAAFNNTQCVPMEIEPCTDPVAQCPQSASMERPKR